MVKHTFSALAIVAALAASAAQAQQPTTQLPNQPGQPAAGGQYAGAQGASASAQVDQAIAACLALGNEEEIALAQFAESRVKNEKVKQFVAMMIKDHREAIEKLHKVAPHLATLNLQLDGDAGQDGQTAAGGDVNQQMLALQRNVAQQCLELTQNELDEKEGAEFDRCFIGQQVGAHIAMLAKLKGSEKFASGALRSHIQEATQTVESHLQHAKELAKTLMDEASHESAQRDDNSRR